MINGVIYARIALSFFSGTGLLLQIYQASSNAKQRAFLTAVVTSDLINRFNDD